MTLSHRHLAVDHHIVGIVDYPVNDCIRNRTIVVRIEVDAIIPALSLILSAEDHRPLNASFDYFKQIIAFACCQFTDQSFIKYQKIDLLVIFDDLA